MTQNTTNKDTTSNYYARRMHILKKSANWTHICAISHCTHVRIWIPEGTLKIQEPIIWLIIFLHLSIIVKLKEKCSEPFSPRTHQVRAAFMQIKLDKAWFFKLTYRREECVLDEAWTFDKTNIYVRITITKNEGRSPYQTRAVIHMFWGLPQTPLK